jgi:PleD family two-component response regulator
MPGMDGMEVCRKIRRMKLPVRPAVLIVSVKDGKDTVVEALSNGADDFIVKPFNETISGPGHRPDKDKRVLPRARRGQENLETIGRDRGARPRSTPRKS